MTVEYVGLAYELPGTGTLFDALSLEGPDGVQVPLMQTAYRNVSQAEGFAGVKARPSVRPAVGRNGSVSSTRFRDDRLMTVTGLVYDQYGSDPARAWMEWDSIEAAFAGAVDTDRLLMWSAGGRDLQATVRLEDLSNPVEVGPNVLRYQASLRNCQAAAYSQALQVVTVASVFLSGGGGMSMPASFPVSFLPVAANQTSARNEGPLPSPPTLVLNGFQRDPIITYGDYQLVIEGEIASGDELWLNAEDRSVLLNNDPLMDRRSMYRSAQSRWFDLPSKVSALIGLHVTDFDGGAALQVRFRHAY